MNMKTYGILFILVIALAWLGGCTLDTTTPPPTGSAGHDELTVTYKWCDPAAETCVMPGMVPDAMQRPLRYLWPDETGNIGCAVGYDCDPCVGVFGDFTLCDFGKDGDVLALVRVTEASNYVRAYCGEANDFLADVTLTAVEVLLVLGHEPLPSRMTLVLSAATRGSEGLFSDAAGPTALVSLRKVDEGWVVARQIEAAFDAPAHWARAPRNRCQALVLPADIDTLQSTYAALQHDPTTVCGDRASDTAFTQLMWGPAPDHYGCTSRPSSETDGTPSSVAPSGLEMDGE